MNQPDKSNANHAESQQREPPQPSSRSDAERKLREQREKELSTPRMQELKNAALDYFDAWRTRVIERVGEAVSTKEKTLRRAKFAHVPGTKQHAPKDHKLGDPGQDVSVSPDEKLKKLFPPIETSLSVEPPKSREVIINSLLLILLSLEHYEAPSRILLLYLCSSLDVSLAVLTEDEKKVAQGLLEAAKKMSGDAETQKKIEGSKESNKWKIGIASVAGAALIGITGGLAAPLVAAGLGTVMGGLGLGATAAAGYLGAVAGSSVIVGGLFGAYGGRMTGQMMDRYAREVEDFAFLPMRKGKDGNVILDQTKLQSAHADTTKGPSSKTHDDKEGLEDPSQRRLKLTIGITGWLTESEEVIKPWRVLGQNSEVFALRWELEALKELGSSLETLVSSAAWRVAKHEIISRTILAQLASAAAWPVALLGVGRIVDNPFSIAKNRADKAGEVLADALINRAQGERPVTLIGYSLGARVIFSCLKSLARRHAFGMIESALLIGAPTPATTADWRVIRSVVAGRLVNVFSSNDYILGFLYRTSSIQYGVAGLQKVEGIPSVENVDVSETISGHLRYRYLIGNILRKLDFEDVDLAAVKQEEATYQKLVEDEKKKTYQETAKESGQKVLGQNPLGLGQKKEHSVEQLDKNEDGAAEQSPGLLTVANGGEAAGSNESHQETANSDPQRVTAQLRDLKLEETQAASKQGGIV